MAPRSGPGCLRILVSLSHLLRATYGKYVWPWRNPVWMSESSSWGPGAGSLQGAFLWACPHCPKVKVSQRGDPRFPEHPAEFHTAMHLVMPSSLQATLFLPFHHQIKFYSSFKPPLKYHLLHSFGGSFFSTVMVPHLPLYYNSPLH